MEFGVANVPHTVRIHQLGRVTVTQTAKTLDHCPFKGKVALVTAGHTVLLAVGERSQDVCHVVDV